MASIDPITLKHLKVKTGVVNRVVKDYEYAQREVTKERDILTKYEEEDHDKLSLQRNVVQEAEMMLPHNIGRLRTAHDDLQNFIAANKDAIPASSDDATQPQNDDLTNARSALAKAEEVLSAATA